MTAAPPRDPALGKTSFPALGSTATLLVTGDDPAMLTLAAHLVLDGIAVAAAAVGAREAHLSRHRSRQPPAVVPAGGHRHGGPRHGRAGSTVATSLMVAVDRIACTGHGLCAELLPELISLDEWGCPILDPALVPGPLTGHARRAVAARPALALRIDEAPRPSGRPSRRR